MGQALYRKHRPKKLSEVVGQEHITQTLSQALKQGRISHAYLFTGPRGVGKTSVARILAHEINGLPYTDDSQHMDIIEIDAASNRRIDEIRELRDKVYIAPTSAKYKVYIIDEVHMLTREAFNALLKTLEEPPAHVVFILATTDAHKLPETIVSRTQRFSFKPVEPEKVIAHLQDIAKQEKISVDDEALGLLAEHGEGSFRDSISLLDQASSRGSRLTADDVRQLLGIPPATAIDQLMADMASGSPSQIMSGLDDLYNQGYQATAIAKQLSQRLRTKLMDDVGTSVGDLRLLKRLLEVPAAYEPERLLEILLLEAAPARNESVEVSQPEPEPVVAETPETEPPVVKPVKKASSIKLDAAVWLQVLNVLKQMYNTLYGIARMAEPRFDGDQLELAFAFAFHQKRLNEAANRKLLADIIKDLTGQSVIITCVQDETLPTAAGLGDQSPPPDAGMAAISNIFGGVELLES